MQNWSSQLTTGLEVSFKTIGCFKDFRFLAKALLGDGGCRRKIGGFMSDASEIWIGGGMIAGANGIGDTGGLRTVTERFIDLSEEEVGYSEAIDVCTWDPVSIYFKSFSNQVAQIMN